MDGIYRFYNTISAIIMLMTAWGNHYRLICIRLAIIALFVSNVYAQDHSYNEQQYTIQFGSAQELLSQWDSLESTNGLHFIELSAEEWLPAVIDFENQAMKQSDDSTLFQLRYVHGSLLFYLSRYNQAIPYLKSTLDQRAALSESQLKWTLVNLEESYRRTANLKEAIPLRKERIELGLDNDFFEIYEEAGLYNEAIVEFTQHNAFPKSPLGRLGYHARIGRLHNQNNQLDSAIYHYEMAFAYGFETLDKEDYLGNSPQYDFRKKFWTYEMQGEIGVIYTKQGRYEDAIPLLKKIIAVGKEINEFALVVPKRLALAECYLNLNEVTLAKRHLDTVRQLTDQMDWFLHKVKYHEVLGEYFFSTGVFDSAAMAYKEYTKLKDSIQSTQNENKLIATTAFLDNERQGKLLAEQRLKLAAFENDRIQKTNQIIMLIFVFLGSLGLAFFLYLDSRRKQKAKEKALYDKRVIEEQSAKIRELDQVKTRFFSNISHEFRTPLTLIQGPIESILLGKAKDEASLEKNLKVAKRNVHNLRSLIDEILEFNNLEMGSLEITYLPVVVVDFLSELSQNYETLIAERGLEWLLHHNIQPSLQLSLPIDKVERILHNLLSNAIKHSPIGAGVGLDVSYENGLFSVKVTDEGMGIALADQEKIFERFYQAAEGKLMPHSSGIGLAYVKEITEALGGSITVKSEIVKGTSFLFQLPAQLAVSNAQQPLEVDETNKTESPAYPYSNNKILVTEDNEEMANYIRQVLGDEFQIEWAENGQVALEKLQDFDADLVISDIMMPVMDGLELLEKLKSDDRHKFRSVIMLTAKSNQATRLDALSFGLDDYLTKPFNPLELEFRVKNLLKNQYERAEWLKKEEMADEEIKDPLIRNLISEIEKNITNRNFGVLDLSSSVALSDRQLTRVVKKSIGMTPANLIREVKLQKAKSYLETKTYRTVSETCYAVGFEKPGYFSTVYFERYGKKPSSYFA